MAKKKDVPENVVPPETPAVPSQEPEDAPETPDMTRDQEYTLSGFPILYA